MDGNRSGGKGSFSDGYSRQAQVLRDVPDMFFRMCNPRGLRLWSTRFPGSRVFALTRLAWSTTSGSPVPCGGLSWGARKAATFTAPGTPDSKPHTASA